MKKLLGLVAAGAFFIGAALAQVPALLISSPTGLEQIEVLVPSTGTVVTNPQKQQVTLNQIRNAAGVQVVATGTTVNTTVPNTVSKLVASGAITTWNIIFPTSPYDGELLAVACPGGAASTVAMATTGGPTGVSVVGTAFTACGSGGVAADTAEWVYSRTANVWYRIQ
jgi:hypothetical protein